MCGFDLCFPQLRSDWTNTASLNPRFEDSSNLSRHRKLLTPETYISHDQQLNANSGLNVSLGTVANLPVARVCVYSDAKFNHGHPIRRSWARLIFADTPWIEVFGSVHLALIASLTSSDTGLLEAPEELF
jgi:hypothetical protein